MNNFFHRTAAEAFRVVSTVNFKAFLITKCIILVFSWLVRTYRGFGIVLFKNIIILSKNNILFPSQSINR